MCHYYLLMYFLHSVHLRGGSVTPVKPALTSAAQLQCRDSMVLPPWRCPQICELLSPYGSLLPHWQSVCSYWAHPDALHHGPIRVSPAYGSLLPHWQSFCSYWAHPDALHHGPIQISPAVGPVRYPRVDRGISSLGWHGYTVDFY